MEKRRQFDAEKKHEMHVSNLLMIVDEQFVSLTKHHKKRMLFDFNTVIKAIKI